MSGMRNLNMPDARQVPNDIDNSNIHTSTGEEQNSTKCPQNQRIASPLSILLMFHSGSNAPTIHDSRIIAA